MKIIYNNIIPFRGFKDINLFGVLFVRKGKIMTDIDINHASIHTKQMKELLYIGFYIWYFIEWLIELFHYKNKAYRTNTFEREAYDNDQNLNYLNERERYAWIKYI